MESDTPFSGVFGVTFGWLGTPEKVVLFLLPPQSLLLAKGGKNPLSTRP